VFDSYQEVIRVGPERVDVHEHRAPTDESIRLYREMLEKARTEVLRSLLVDTKLGPFRVLQVQDPTGDGPTTKLAFMLNGQEFSTEVQVTNLERLQSHDRDRLIDLYARRLAEAIADALLAPVLTEAMRGP